jgi:diaminohydroxyphosphoribosylaminopyrimidine deaminase/5-amino-6-(5-phosphoribosylamino)uracil reductase
MTHMQKAISLARNVRGTTSPNPAVGAVVVRDGVEVGSGATMPPGQSHAEIGALQQAGEASRGSTLYTTLEPCCIHGRTPPCTGAIIGAGVERVHVAAIDPNPKVSGRGCAELQSAGIQVVLGEEAEAAKELYEAFAKHVSTGLPFVTAKFAMSLDGKIATYSGDSKWVTGPLAREEVQRIRRESDAVMVGINTVLADDPQLTARAPDGLPLPRQPLRVVLDSHCRTPVEARMLQEPGATLIATSSDAPPEQIAFLRDVGAEVLTGPMEAPGMVDMSIVLSELGKRGIVSLLVEGGGITLGTLFDTGLVDKVYVFIAPVIIGGSLAASPIEGHGTALMSEAWQVDRAAIRQIGPDWLISGYPTREGR